MTKEIDCKLLILVIDLKKANLRKLVYVNCHLRKIVLTSLTLIHVIMDIFRLSMLFFRQLSIYETTQQN